MAYDGYYFSMKRVKVIWNVNFEAIRTNHRRNKCRPRMWDMFTYYIDGCSHVWLTLKWVKRSDRCIALVNVIHCVTLTLIDDVSNDTDLVMGMPSLLLFVYCSRAIVLSRHFDCTVVMATVDSFSLFSVNRLGLDCVSATMYVPIVVNLVAIRATIVSLISVDSVRIAVQRSNRILNFAVLTLIHLDIVRFLAQLHANVVVSLHHSHAFLRYIQNYRNCPRTYSIGHETLWPDPMSPICLSLLLVLQFVRDQPFPILMVWIRPDLPMDFDHFYYQLVCRRCPDRPLIEDGRKHETILFQIYFATHENVFNAVWWKFTYAVCHRYRLHSQNQRSLGHVPMMVNHLNRLHQECRAWMRFWVKQHHPTVHHLSLRLLFHHPIQPTALVQFVFQSSKVYWWHSMWWNTMTLIWQNTNRKERKGKWTYMLNA